MNKVKQKNVEFYGRPNHPLAKRAKYLNMVVRQLQTTLY